MFKSKTLKYSLDLTVNELVNIPQVGGGCFIEMQIKDSKRHVGSLNVIKHHTNINKSNNKSEEKNGSETKGSDNVVSTSSSNSSGNISLTTSTKRIHNFRCVFNYKISCNLKFTVKKRGEELENKYVIMKVYYVSDSSGKNSSGSSSATKLGIVELNLRDYIGVEEMVKSKFLLKNSKVNSIVRLSLQLIELPASFDFRTQLQVSEYNGLSTGADSDRENTFAGSPTTTSFGFLNLDKKHFPMGRNDSTGMRRQEDSSSSTMDSEDHFDKHNQKNRKSIQEGKWLVSEMVRGKEEINHDNLIDPMIIPLYRKVLESAWDSDLHELMEYTPEQSVNDMFDNPERFEKHLIDLKNKSRQYEDVRDLNGLIDERDYRSDLKSWYVSAS